MRERGLAPEFSTDALRQAEALVGPAQDADPAIKDLRGLPWSSIDNDDSRDLDQVEVAERLGDGACTVRVAIADVDSCVGAGSPIDAHALLNTTSVYTAAQIFPMLPERLSTNLTSLAEDQERLAIVFEMTIAPDGQVLESSLYRALVRNQAKLAYAAVAAWLEGRAGAPARVQESRELQQQLRLQDEVAQQLRGLRHQHGALDLQTEEARAVFDNGLLSDLKPEPQNRAHELIED